MLTSTPFSCVFSSCAGVPPFRGETADEVFAAILDHENTLWFPTAEDGLEVSPEAQDLIRK